MEKTKEIALVERRLSKAFGLPVRILPARLWRRNTSNLVLFKKKATNVVVSPAGGCTAAASSDDKESA